MMDHTYDYNEFRKRAMEIANSEISKFTVPVFEKGVRKTPKLRGSGVFVSVSGAFYLLTASHVIAGKETEDLYVPGYQRVLIPIGGEGWHYLNDDPDVAVIKIESATAVQLFFSHNCLPYHLILIDFPALRNQEFIAVGFPELFFMQTASGSNLDFYYLLLRKASDQAYKYHNISPKLNYVLQWGKTETIDGLKIEKTEPYGMSGGGLWLVTIESLGPPMTVTYRLVGLMYGYKRTRHQVLVASKIRSAIELLQRADQIRDTLKQ